MTSSVMLALLGLLPAALRSATPLLFALLGETFTQRAGVVNLGTEGQMLVGAATAFGATLATGSPVLGLLAGALAGSALSLVHALLCLRFQANQFASGLAVWMIGFGTSSYLGQRLVGQSLEGFAPLASTWLGRAVPLLNEVTPTVPLAGAAALMGAFFLWCTRPGLWLRAVGESVASARAAGLPVRTIQTLAIAVPAALLFGGAEALSLRLQSAGADTSAHLLHTLPYVVSLAVFVITCARRAGAAPAELSTVLER